MILVTLTLPLGALLLMHALQLLETWALHDDSTVPGGATAGRTPPGSDGAAAGGSTAAPSATTP
jgi:hypothetical protein